VATGVFTPHPSRDGCLPGKKSRNKGAREMSDCPVIRNDSLPNPKLEKKKTGLSPVLYTK
jgi:hypothetical protein